MLGADSTSSADIAPRPGYRGYHYYNHNQKLFEIGEGSTLGAVTWGLGSLGSKSHRTVLAELGDEIAKAKPKTTADAVTNWATVLWKDYQAGYPNEIQRCKDLAAKVPFGQPIPPGGQGRSEAEESEFLTLKTALVLGFCVGGYLPPDRTTSAFELLCDPLGAAPVVRQLAGPYWFWGVPNLVQRLIHGADDNLKAAILASPNWTGTEKDLDDIMLQQRLGHHLLPIRDAVDFVNTCIYSTIKAMKFSNFFQFCGGPIELAVISTDRKFRWVRHKSWDSAIDGG